MEKNIKNKLLKNHIEDIEEIKLNTEDDEKALAHKGKKLLMFRETLPDQFVKALKDERKGYIDNQNSKNA